MKKAERYCLFDDNCGYPPTHCMVRTFCAVSTSTLFWPCTDASPHPSTACGVGRCHALGQHEDQCEPNTPKGKHVRDDDECAYARKNHDNEQTYRCSRKGHKATYAKITYVKPRRCHCFARRLLYRWMCGVLETLLSTVYTSMRIRAAIRAVVGGIYTFVAYVIPTPALSDRDFLAIVAYQAQTKSASFSWDFYFYTLGWCGVCVHGACVFGATQRLVRNRDFPKGALHEIYTIFFWRRCLRRRRWQTGMEEE